MKHNISFKPPFEGSEKKLVWLSDLHLDAANEQRQRQLFNVMLAEHSDAILIGGDISNGTASFAYMKYIASLTKQPIYFVLGNHDFYYSSIEKNREMARQLSKECGNLIYLTDGVIAELAPETGLVGHDGWSDGRVGNFLDSTIMLNDYLLIEELKNISHTERLKRLEALGDEGAIYAKIALEKAFEKYGQVIFLTHTPPFREACCYEGKMSDDNWAPHFVCRALGDALMEVMNDRSDKRLLVLCGHSHSSADVQILPNLRVVAGHSDLGTPTVQGVVTY